MDLRRAQVATGANDGLQIPYRPLTGGNTFGIPYAYQWVYTQPSRVEDRALVIRLIAPHLLCFSYIRLCPEGGETAGPPERRTHVRRACMCARMPHR
jgi:hypothetical protein